jgi:hypothetical protein
MSSTVTKAFSILYCAVTAIVTRWTYWNTSLLFCVTSDCLTGIINMITVSVLLVAVLNNLHAVLLHRVGFSYGALVTHQYVLVLSVSVKYVLVLSVLLVPSVLMAHLSPGFSGSSLPAVHPSGLSGSDIQDIYVIQCCTSTCHSTSRIHHTLYI